MRPMVSGYNDCLGILQDSGRMNLKDGCPGSNLLNVEASGTQMPISALSRHSSFLLDTLSVILRDTLRSLVF